MAVTALVLCQDQELQIAENEDLDIPQTQSDQSEADIQDETSTPHWIDCDYMVDPKLSCLDCKTRVICTPKGGMVLPCRRPEWSNCYKGICSPVPEIPCDQNE